MFYSPQFSKHIRKSIKLWSNWIFYPSQKKSKIAIVVDMLKKVVLNFLQIEKKTSE